MAKRKPRKKGQHRNSPNHSDLFTDENPKGTIKGLKFATVKDAQTSVNKIKKSGKKHNHNYYSKLWRTIGFYGSTYLNFIVTHQYTMATKDRIRYSEFHAVMCNHQAN